MSDQDQIEKWSYLITLDNLRERQAWPGMSRLQKRAWRKDPSRPYNKAEFKAFAVSDLGKKVLDVSEYRIEVWKLEDRQKAASKAAGVARAYAQFCKEGQ